MDDNYELSHKSSAFKIPDQSLPSQHGSISRDEADLVRLGKKPVLKVNAPPHPSDCSSD